jgi:transposase
MPHILRKKVNGKYYLYLVKSARVDGKSKKIWQKYLGPEDDIQNAVSFTTLKDIQSETLSFGIEAALLDTARKVDLANIIDKHVSKSRDQGLSVGDYITLAAINRCASPCSKDALGPWFKTTFLPSVFPIDPSVLNSQTYWNHFAYFDTAIIDAIETELSEKILKDFNLPLNTILYDPTNFYTFIEDHDDNDLPRTGHSKEHRSDLNIINVALFCTRDFGIPIKHETYAGNEPDVTHFKGVIAPFIERMQQFQHDVKDITIVFDKGNLSPEAFHDIKDLNVHFVASLRPSSHQDLLDLPLTRFTPFILQPSGKKIWYHHVERKVYEVDRDVYITFDPRHYKKNKRQLQARVTSALNEVNDYFKERLNVNKWREKANVEEKIQAIIGKSLYNTVVKVDVTGDYGALSFTMTPDKAEMSHDAQISSTSLLFTSRGDWDAETVIQTYREQHVIENAFKCMKSPVHIAIRPMFHHVDSSIRVHVFTCVLALLLLALTRLCLYRKKILTSYPELLETLEHVKVTRMQLPGSDKHYDKLNKLGEQEDLLFSALKLKAWIT